MRQSAKAIVKRWMALDRELYRRRRGQGWGVSLDEFAADRKVNVKTIQRDLVAFGKLGYKAVPDVDESEEFPRWAYPRGQRPMFTASMK